MSKRVCCLVAGIAVLAVVMSASAQEEERNLDEIVVTGTRVADRTALETAAPVDVFPIGKLTGSGRSELSQILATTIPSFNFDQTAISDGTDIIRPASLRGLQPDQTLILLNGKRRHTSALLNILNGTSGRGSAAVDLNAIPTSAIGSIQVLRDGASAQYGSDAIAGVINVLLREADSGGSLSLRYGSHVSAPPDLARQAVDGQTLTADGWAGFSIGDNGFATLSAQYKDRLPTNRAGPDTRQQYPNTADGGLDPRELTFDRINFRWGNGNANDYSLFLNTGLSTGIIEYYGFAGYQHRVADSPGYFRRALDNRNTPEIYPDGFLPVIGGTVDDYTLGAGVKGDLSELTYDLSLVYGNNNLGYRVTNTLNASLGPSSQTEFDAGALNFNQWTANADFTWGGGPVSLAAGAEYRFENFRITEGEQASYILGPVPDKDPGSQVFPGFRPEAATNQNRSAYGLYVDGEWEVSDQFLVTAAARYENYSDFGTTLNWKVSGRFDLTEAVGLRAAASTGFRAPSLHQQYFSAITTDIVDGVLFQVLTTPATSVAAMTLGGKQLQAENATNYSLGVVFRPSDDWFLTIDGYRINIRDQIILTENLGGDAVLAELVRAGVEGVSSIQFFQNGVETQNTGVDVVSRYDFDMGAIGNFGISAAFNWNNVDVLKVPTNEIIPDLILFNRNRQLTLENSAPETKLIFAVDWDYKNALTTLNITRYGSVLSPAELNDPANDFLISPQIVVDLSVDVEVADQLFIGIGADNLLDAYPNSPIGNPQGFDGILAYSIRSPFGFSGRFIYARASYQW